LSGAAYLATLMIEELVPRPSGGNLAAASMGLKQEEIATKLALSKKTVEHHIAKAIKGLGAKNITEACVQAVRYKFFS
jgi:DNA-binding NarL/FixJ family response regulator